jgi:hypothetical protein
MILMTTGNRSSWPAQVPCGHTGQVNMATVPPSTKMSVPVM